MAPTQNNTDNMNPYNRFRYIKPFSIHSHARAAIHRCLSQNTLLHTRSKRYINANRLQTNNNERKKNQAEVDVHSI